MRKLALLLLPLALLVASCGGGDTDTNDGSLERDGDVYHIEPDASDIDDAAAEVLTALNPLVALNGFGAPPASDANIDPALLKLLLTQSDLPAGFIDTQDMAVENGPFQIAGRLFSTTDLESDTPGTAVMSVAVAAPDDVLDRFQKEGGFDQLNEMTDDYLALSGTEDFASVQALDASGLGDAGFAMRLEIDMSGFVEAFTEGFGAVEAHEAPITTGIAMEMYAFVSGDHILMAAVLWPADYPPAADARPLAELMNSRT